MDNVSLFSISSEVMGPYQLS